ncbi:hypothetical protein TNCV_1821361 [Trichonephila clavipes]|nr:hypothetical protein TNCV_1821361 [Trichonephila clavipes]
MRVLSDRHQAEAFHVDFLVPSMKHGEGFVMWGAITCRGLENKVRIRFPPLYTLSELQTALHEKLGRISMNFVQNHYLSIPPWMQAVIQAKDSPNAY